MDPIDGIGARRLLVVEDDPELRTLLVRLLTAENYDVDEAGDGQAGLHRALTDPYDVMIVDKGLPAIDGVDLTRRLRAQGLRTPIMILTAYSTVPDRVAGLDAGAEDYVIKPFDIDELLARLRALVRRTAAAPTAIRLGALRIDLGDRVARRPDGGEIPLSGRECALIALLAERPTRVFSRDELRATVFDNAESETVVDTYVHYIRRKLGRSAIRTVRGHGYRIGSG
ncbi:MAG TPA: response regulator transcription factor [Micromonosporaceae bacterium]